MAGFDNDVMYASNVDFTGASPVSAQVTTNGQLLIGSTASPNIRVGSLASAGGTIVITTGAGTIDLATSGSAVGNTITGDTGGALSPTAGNWNILGQQASTIAVMDTVGSGSTLSIEDRTWVTQYVVDPSATVGLRGTFSTIQAAITAASSGQNIFIRPGTYTENLTLKDGVNLIGMGNVGSTVGPTIIVGKGTLTSGRVVIENIELKTNSDYLLDLSGGCTAILNSCFVWAANNNAAINGSSSTIILNNCNGTDSAAGTGPYFTGSSLTITLNGCNLDGTSANANTIANGGITLNNSRFTENITTSGTANFVSYNSTLGYSSSSHTALIHNGTGTTSFALNCQFMSNSTVSPLTIGAGASLNVSQCTIYSNLGTGVAISGAGTIVSSNLAFAGSASTNTVTTQTPQVISNDNIKVVTPGVYPYTTVPQDGIILVDTSVARTITPLASPTTGQRHIIKDSVGSAAANNITITPSGKNIDGAASSTININYGSVTIIYNGTEWSIV